MNIKALGIVTVALIAVAAVVANRGGNTSAADASSDSALLFPALEERINDVARVEVVDKDGSFEVAREGETWGMPSKGGYPIDFSKVKQLVVAISELEKLEKKTKTPEKFAQLGVEDVDAPDAESKLVRLKAADGGELASVLIGDTRSGGRGQPSLYVRKAGDDQSWLVEGRVFIEPAGNWLEKTVAEIGFERMSGATITHPTGEVVRISRTSPDETDFALQDLPEGRELRYAGVASGVARALQRLTLEDVKPADEFQFDALGTYVSEFTTWDGLRVTVRAVDVDEKSYLKLEASFDETLRAAPVGPEPPPGDAPGDATSDEAADDDSAVDDATETAQPDEPEEIGKPVEEVQSEVEELNARWGPWVYIVPGYTASNFKKSVEELLKPLTDESAADPTSPFGVGGVGGLGGTGEGEPTSLEDLFPDGLPEELQGIDFGEQTPGLRDTTEGLENIDELDESPVLKDAEIEDASDILGDDDLPADPPSPADTKSDAAGGTGGETGGDTNQDDGGSE